MHSNELCFLTLAENRILTQIYLAFQNGPHYMLGVSLQLSVSPLHNTGPPPFLLKGERVVAPKGEWWRDAGKVSQAPQATTATTPTLLPLHSAWRGGLLSPSSLPPLPLVLPSWLQSCKVHKIHSMLAWKYITLGMLTKTPRLPLKKAFKVKKKIS